MNASEDRDKRIQCSSGNLYKNLKRRQSDFPGQIQSQLIGGTAQNMATPTWHYMNPAVSPGKHRSSYHFEGSPAKVSWNSSGISSAATILSDDVSIFFKFPDVEEPAMVTCGNNNSSTSNSNFGKPYQCEHSDNSGSKNNSPGVVYSELDSSLGLGCSRNNGNGIMKQSRGVFCSSGEGAQPYRVPENARKESNSSLVSYSVLDVDRTRALASIGDDREMLNQWRNRRASSAACQNQSQAKGGFPGIQEKNGIKRTTRSNSINPPLCTSENSCSQTFKETRQTRHI